MDKVQEPSNSKWHSVPHLYNQIRGMGTGSHIRTRRPSINESQSCIHFSWYLRRQIILWTLTSGQGSCRVTTPTTGMILIWTMFTYFHKLIFPAFREIHPLSIMYNEWSCGPLNFIPGCVRRLMTHTDINTCRGRGEQGRDRLVSFLQFWYSDYSVPRIIIQCS
jgi:hypothetical protein